MRVRPFDPALTGLGLLACTVCIVMCTATNGRAQAKQPGPPTGKPTPAAAPNQAAKPTSTGAPASSAGQTTVVAPKPQRHGSPITALAFSTDGKKLAIGTYGEVALFDTSTWTETGRFSQVAESVRTLAFQPNGSILAIGSGLPGRSGLTTLWDTAGSGKPFTYTQQYDTVESVAFNKDGTQILLGANDNKAHLYTSLSGNAGTSIDAHNGRVTAVAFSPNVGTLYITGGMDKIVKVWVQKTGQNVCNFDQCDSGLTGLVWLNNGTQFVGSGLDGKLYWWGVSHDDRKDTYGGYFFRQFEAHPGGIYAMAGSANGQRIITGGADKAVCIWNPDNGQKIQAFTDSQNPIYAVALSPDGKTAVAGGRDGEVLIWDVDGKKLLNTVAPSAAPAASKPAGKTAVQSSASETTHKHS